MEKEDPTGAKEKGLAILAARINLNAGGAAVHSLLQMNYAGLAFTHIRLYEEHKELAALKNPPEETLKDYKIKELAHQMMKKNFTGQKTRTRPKARALALPTANDFLKKSKTTVQRRLSTQEIRVSALETEIAEGNHSKKFSKYL